MSSQKKFILYICAKKATEKKNNRKALLYFKYAYEFVLSSILVYTWPHIVVDDILVTG